LLFYQFTTQCFTDDDDDVR